MFELSGSYFGEITETYLFELELPLFKKVVYLYSFNYNAVFIFFFFFFLTAIEEG